MSRSRDIADGTLDSADINGGTIDGTDITVGSGKTLDVSAGAFTASSVNGGQLAGMRNLIINGDMRIWQRGDNSSGSGYFADRWVAISGLTSIGENASGSPTGFSRNAYIRRNVTGAAIIGQRIEASNCYQLVGKQTTVQFYHSTVSGTCNSIVIELRYATAADDFSSSTSIQTTTINDTSNGYKTFTFDALPSNVTNGIELRITYNVTGDTYVRLTAVQLEVGSTATAFEHRHYGVELALCQRYYYKWKAVYLYSHLCEVTFRSSAEGRGNICLPVEPRDITACTATVSSNSDFYLLGHAASSGMTVTAAPAESSRNNVLIKVILSSPNTAIVGYSSCLRANGTTNAAIEFDFEL